MRFVRWWLPALIVAALVGVVAVDLYQVLRARPPVDERLFEASTIWFEPRDWLIDFRARAGDPPVIDIEPEYELTSGWETPTRDGVESVGIRSEMTVWLPVGGHRSLFLHCRADHDRRPPPALRVIVNGVDIGSFRLKRAATAHRMELPERLLIGGSNRIMLEVVARGGSGRPSSGRSVLLRRMVLAERVDVELEEIVGSRPAHFNRETQTVVIRKPGRLLVQFDTPQAGSRLTLHSRLRRPAPGALCRVGVGRWFASRRVIDTIGERTLTADSAKRRRLRFFLGHHQGSTVLWVVADHSAAQAEVAISGPRLSVR